MLRRSLIVLIVACICSQAPSAPGSEPDRQFGIPPGGSVAADRNSPDPVIDRREASKLIDKTNELRELWQVPLMRSGTPAHPVLLDFAAAGSTVVVYDRHRIGQFSTKTGRLSRTVQMSGTSMAACHNKIVIGGGAEIQFIKTSGPAKPQVIRGVSVKSVALSPRGDRVICLTEGGAAMFELSRGTRVFTIAHPEAIVATFSQDGESIVTATNGSAVWWNGKTGKRTRDAVLFAKWDVTAKRRIVVADDGSALFDIQKEEVRAYNLSDGSLIGHCDCLSPDHLAVSPDGGVLVFYEDGEATVTRMGDCETIGRIRGDFDSITAVAVAPDNAAIAAIVSQSDAISEQTTFTLRLWEIPSDEEAK